MVETPVRVDCKVAARGQQRQPRLDPPEVLRERGAVDPNRHGRVPHAEIAAHLLRQSCKPLLFAVLPARLVDKDLLVGLRQLDSGQTPEGFPEQTTTGPVFELRRKIPQSLSTIPTAIERSP